MMLDALLALGLLLSMASQLRLAGSSIGPGEICLLLWLVASLGGQATRGGPALTSALSRLLIFWALFALAESVGTLTGVVIRDDHDQGLFLHDVLAYLLLAPVSCLIGACPGARRRLSRVAWLVAALGSVLLALQLANGWGWFDLARIEPWYWDRFRGWSANPNQLALLCAVLGLLSLHLSESAAGLPGSSAAMACIILPIWVGQLTKSDTFVLVLLAAGPVFVAVKLRTWMTSSEPGITLRSAVAWVAVAALPLVLVSAVSFTSLVAAEAKSFGRQDNNRADKEAELRFHLWGEAINRGLEAGMLGLGPGPHLPIPPSLVAARENSANAPGNIVHPKPGALPNFEAHNTLLDLFTQGGLLAVLAFLWLGATSLVTTYRARLAGLTTLLCGLGIFTVTHLIVRLPIFWFAIVLCLVAGDQAGRARTISGGAAGRVPSTLADHSLRRERRTHPWRSASATRRTTPLQSPGLD